MANLSKFHVVFSSSTLIRLDKDAFEGHLCQTVNNFVKQNESSLLSPLRKRRPPHSQLYLTVSNSFDPLSDTNFTFEIDSFSSTTPFVPRIHSTPNFNPFLPRNAIVGYGPEMPECALLDSGTEVP